MTSTTTAQNHAYGAPHGVAIDTLIENAGPGYASSGVTITADQALGLAPVWEAVSLISGHIAGMELQVIRHEVNGNETPVKAHPVYRLLNRKPNDWQTPFTFRETLMGHALVQGNGRAKIIRNGLGQPIDLVPLFPWHAYTVIMDGEKWHANYTHPDHPGPVSATEGHIELLHDSDVLHVPGFTYNGFWGIHLTQAAKDVLGVAAAGQDRTGSSFQNQGMPGFLIELPIGVFRNAQQRAEFKAEWNASYTGSRNAGKMQLLPEGFKAHAASVTAHDAQLSGLVELSTEQIRRLFLLPPDAAAAYKSITERNAQYITNCLARWMNKWVQECYTKLLSERERIADSHSLRFNTDLLVKGDPNTWASYTSSLRQQGLINGNEGRQMHGLNAVADEALESYGNPNITTPTDAVEASEIEAETSEEEDNEEEQDSEAQNLARKAIGRHFANLIALEMQQVKRHTGKENYPEWLAKYYTGINERLADLCSDFGIPESAAADHCAENLAELTRIANHVTPEQLKNTIAVTVDGWNNQLERFLSHV